MFGSKQRTQTEVKKTTKKRKILFLTHYFPPESNAPASRVHEMAKLWVQDDYDVTVITCAPNCPNGIVYDTYQNKLIQREVIDGINVIRVWTFLAANRGTVRRIMNYVSYMLSAVLAGLFVKKPDVLIATSPQFFCGWAGTFLKIIKRVPFILEIRDIWPESIVAVGAIKNRHMVHVLERLERWMYASATHIVTVGKGYMEQLVKKGVDPSRISIISNGVDVKTFSSQSRDEVFRKRYGINGEFVCAYVGTLGMASGLNVVIEAAKILKRKGLAHFKFMLVGDGAMREELQQKVEELKLNNVVFTGRLAKDMMPGCLASADCCLVHLRRTELFRSVLPSKIFEAAAMERPIILGVEGHAANLVSEAHAGICIEPENAYELSDAMTALANDQVLAHSYGFAGSEYMKTHFDRKVLARRYLEDIHLMLAKHSDRRAKDLGGHVGEIVGQRKQWSRHMLPAKTEIV
jgi:colanic acid biosynthesis glycosyl transferase WcaI